MKFSKKEIKKMPRWKVYESIQRGELKYVDFLKYMSLKNTFSMKSWSEGYDQGYDSACENLGKMNPTLH